MCDVRASARCAPFAGVSQPLIRQPCSVDVSVSSSFAASLRQERSAPAGSNSTAHRGLASATLFTNLNRVVERDRFTLEVLGEVFTYEVRETKVVEPDQTEALRAIPGEDLVTLITCTPLGINTQRILVIGERVLPIPAADATGAGTRPAVPCFPWWALIVAGGTAAGGVYIWRMGLPVTAKVVEGSPAST